jgi:hypothetical protein
MLSGIAGAQAATLEVGPGKPFAMPSLAIGQAKPGDTVEIAAGEYFDCAVISANGLTIIGLGDGATLTDKTCQGKAILVVAANDITLRNLTLARARVPDENGAGIRAEGVNLTIDHVRFIDNEEGILTVADPHGTIRVLDSVFEHNGRCRRQCAHGIYAGPLDLLDVERTKFLDTREGHHIKSRALRTVLVGNEFRDGETGTSSYLVEIPNGGSLVMRDNLLEKGPRTSNPSAAVMLGSEAETQDTKELLIERNRFINDTGANPVFVMNWTGTDAVLRDNQIPPGVTEETGRGRWWHKLRRAGAETRDTLKDVYGGIRSLGGAALRKVGLR